MVSKQEEWKEIPIEQLALPRCLNHAVSEQHHETWTFRKGNSDTTQTQFRCQLCHSRLWWMGPNSRLSVEASTKQTVLVKEDCQEMWTCEAMQHSSGLFWKEHGWIPGKWTQCLCLCMDWNVISGYSSPLTSQANLDRTGSCLAKLAQRWSNPRQEKPVSKPPPFSRKCEFEC